jgi:K+/H+ antiporter YhaU regulatory subunit KhtT
MGMDDDMDMDDEDMGMEEQVPEEVDEDEMEDDGKVMESLKKRVSKLLESYVKEKDPKTYINDIKKITKTNRIIEKHSNTVDQELSAKRFIKENKATIKGLTKNGTIVMISEGKKVYIDKNGSIR